MPHLYCPASLMPWACHNRDLLMLLRQQEVTAAMISYIAEKTAGVIAFEEPSMEQAGFATLPTVHKPPSPDDVVPAPPFPPLVHLEKFIAHIVYRSKIPLPTLLATLIYLRRLKSKLPPTTTGIPGARYRIFLASLVIASKYLNDFAPKNRIWAEYSACFDTRDVNIMEIQLLQLLDYDLRFDESEAWATFSPLMPAAAQQTRRDAVKKVTKASKARAMAQEPVRPLSGGPALSRSQPIVAGTLASAVRGLAKRLSATHLNRAPLVTSPVCSNVSAGSSVSATDSDPGSLVDDSGSSYSSESELESGSLSESDDDNYGAQGRECDRTKLKNLVLRQPASQACRDRSRKASNSSVLSTTTIRAKCQLSPRRTYKTMGYRTSTLYAQRTPSGSSDEDTRSSMILSSTLASLRSSASSTSAASNFLSKMWGAAKGQTRILGGHVDIVEPPENQGHPADGNRDSALRRLVYSRSTLLRMAPVDG